MTMKVKFYLGIGHPTATHCETFEFPDDYTDEDIEESLEDWASNYIDMGYTILED